MRVTLVRLVVSEARPGHGPQIITGPVLHILARPGGLTLCGRSKHAGRTHTWRAATAEDRDLHRCEDCVQVERSTQAGERKILRAMGRTGFR